MAACENNINGILTPSQLRKFVKMREAKKPATLIPGILNRQAVTLFYGRPFSHKTYFSVWLGQCWATGAEIPHLSIENKMRILYLNYETPSALFVKRWEISRETMGISREELDKRCRISRDHYQFTELKKRYAATSSSDYESNTSGFIKDHELLTEAINESKADIVIVDSLKSYVGRSRYAAGKNLKIVYNSLRCPIPGTIKQREVYHESS